MLDAAGAIKDGKAEFCIVSSPKTNKSEEVSEPSIPYGSEDNTVPLQQSVSEKDYDDIYFRVKDDDSNIVDLCEKHEQKGSTRFCERNEPQKSETEIDNETAEEIAQIYTRLNETIKSLRLKGITLGAIHEFIDEQEPLSPLVITEDLRIFLPLYNNIEIEMSAQNKALFFLFLNHPEGIVLQHLEDYHNELINYYKQTRKGTLTPKLEEGIRKLETYGNNQINVAIARIREAFSSKFDERLARNYFISGEKGKPYKIPLCPELIEWEE